MTMITDNPVMDAERYASDLDDADRKCLHCVICGSAIWDGNDYYEIDDMFYCEDCMVDSFRKVANYDNL